jgi:hypothetical protein
MWRQRSRTTWLKEGDRNTCYFHKKATWRQRKNKIKKLKDNSGKWVDKQEEIEELTTSFFDDLYTQDTTVLPSDLLDLIHTSVPESTNAELCKEFSDMEISDALFQIGPIKAPGPDGLPAHFFQRNWALLKTEVIKAVKDFFKKGQMPEGINDTVREGPGWWSAIARARYCLLLASIF